MSEWKKVKLGDLATKITKGTTPSNIGDSFCDKGIPFIRSELITQNKYISKEGILYISKQTHEKLKRSQLEVNDILFSMAGVYLGKTAILRECDVPANTNQAVALIRLDSALCSVDFVYYYLNQESVIRYVNQISGQSAQPNINLQQIGEIPIVLPSRKEQKSIATILSRYDSLIENYQKQIKLLEEAVQRLYKEWFVDLRFPGHENTKIVDGLPEGWRYYKICEQFKTVLGGTPSRANSNYWGGNIPWINSGEINKLRIVSASEMITKEGFDNSSTKLMPIHTTILAITGATLGQVSYTEIETCANQSVVGIIDETQLSNEYLYLYIKNNILSIISKATGGAQQHINKDIVNDYPILMPSKELLDNFKKKVEPQFKLIYNKLISIQSIIEARDRLLPKLMSGDIDV